MKNSGSVVYAIEFRGLVKIGMTTNLKQRKPNIPGQVVRTWAGGLGLERSLHRRFRDCRVTGEWFELPIGWQGVADWEVALSRFEAPKPTPSTPAILVSDINELAGVAEVAKFLGIGKRGVQQLVSRGRLVPVGKIGGAWVFRRAAVEALAKSRLG